MQCQAEGVSSCAPGIADAVTETLRHGGNDFTLGKAFRKGIGIREEIPLKTLLPQLLVLHNRRVRGKLVEGFGIAESGLGHGLGDLSQGVAFRYGDAVEQNLTLNKGVQDLAGRHGAVKLILTGLDLAVQVAETGKKFEFERRSDQADILQFAGRGAKTLPRFDGHDMGIAMARVQGVGIPGHIIDTDCGPCQEDQQERRQYFNPFQSGLLPLSCD